MRFLIEAINIGDDPVDDNELEIAKTKLENGLIVPPMWMMNFRVLSKTSWKFQGQFYPEVLLDWTGSKAHARDKAFIPWIEVRWTEDLRFGVFVGYKSPTDHELDPLDNHDPILLQEIKDLLETDFGVKIPDMTIVRNAETYLDVYSDLLTSHLSRQAAPLAPLFLAAVHDRDLVDLIKHHADR